MIQMDSNLYITRDSNISTTKHHKASDACSWRPAPPTPAAAPAPVPAPASPGASKFFSSLFKGSRLFYESFLWLQMKKHWPNLTVLLVILDFKCFCMMRWWKSQRAGLISPTSEAARKRRDKAKKWLIQPGIRRPGGKQNYFSSSQNCFDSKVTLPRSGWLWRPFLKKRWLIESFAERYVAFRCFFVSRTWCFWLGCGFERETKKCRKRFWSDFCVRKPMALSGFVWYSLFFPFVTPYLSSSRHVSRKICMLHSCMRDSFLWEAW